MKSSFARESVLGATSPAFHTTRTFLSAGRSIRFTHRIAHAANAEDCSQLVLNTPSDSKLLAVGSGQSLGDSGLNGGHTLILTRSMNRMLEVDRSAGLVECEPGVTIGQLADVALDAATGSRLFPYVIPGTDIVTVAGAIANDVHGKNHLSHGSFCHHVEGLTLLRSDGDVVDCSETNNPGLFRATLGGLGLTGLILSARIRMRAVAGPLLASEEIRFDSLHEAFALLAVECDSEYRFFWFDPFSDHGRGLFIRSDHVSGEAAEAEPAGTVMRIVSSLPLPSFAGGPSIWKGWYAFMLSRAEQRQARRMSYLDVLAPLGKFKNWSRLLGRHGLLHFQSVLPTASAQEVLVAMLADCKAAGEPPCIASVKQFGSRKPRGMLSFPREGITSALDFCNRGDSTRRLLGRLEARVVDAGGAIYPGKDATMSATGFRRMFPEWEDFAAHMDPRFSSSFWRRVSELP
jgi:FAD/FMN-containing dehydrogenase